MKILGKKNEYKKRPVSRNAHTYREYKYERDKVESGDDSTWKCKHCNRINKGYYCTKCGKPYGQ